jgi:hypothetical protein
VIIGYIDPGAGSLVIQALLAGALAIPFILRTQIGSAIRRLRGRRSDDAATRD